METIAPVKTPKAAILVLHSWWGLTGSFREYGADLADAGYLVGLTDLFDGRTARTEAEARALRSRPRRTPIYKVLGADIAALRVLGGGSELRLGVVGFSMGGHWAVWLSQKPEYRVAATILYYAARAGDFSRCRAGLSAHFAEHDPWVSASARATMERAIRTSGCTYRAFDYPGTRHWFAESARSAEYDRDAARLALDRDRKFLGQILQH